MDADKPPPFAYLFDRFVLDVTRGALLAADRAELPLRPKSFAMLRLLVENAGRLLDRDTIMNAVWPGVIVGDDSITQCVHDIRRAFGGEAQGLLRTVQRRGYLFTAAVVRVEPAASPTFADDNVDSGIVGKDNVAEPSTGAATLGPPDTSFLHSNNTGPIPTGDEPRPGAAPPAPPGAERRHLTILFCALAGLNELTEQLDPEDLGAVIRVYREHFAAAVGRFGGHVESYGGDAMLALFGYPQARENAAERAVRAGLAIVEAAQRPHPDLDEAYQVRISIATGVVVNDPAGQTAQSQGAQGQGAQGQDVRGQIAVGRPLNLAARLLAVAAPGTVTIADSTRQLIGGLFALEDLGRQPVMDISSPPQAWRVTGEGVAQSRFNALRGTSFPPLVGRDQELAMLLDRWAQASEGEGQVVLLAGEAGIGKSRLAHALRDRLNRMPHLYLGCYCSPDRLDSPLQPVIAHLERAANFTSGDGADSKLTKLESLFRYQNNDLARLIPLVAALLSIPGGSRYPPGVTSARQQREQILVALVDVLARLSAYRPVLLVCEDIQWADPTSLELLRLAIDRSQSLPVMVIITVRPGFEPPLPGHTHITGLTLNRLSRGRCGQLVAGLTGKSLPREVLDQIVNCADGVPLFVEELTRQVLESGLLRETDERYELAGRLPRAAIPATLHDSLMARLDRLGAARETAQVAAVIGREFSRDLLVGVSSQAEEVDESLHRLTDAELVFRRGMDPNVTYIFKHALVRDAAYASLLIGKRRQLHAQIARHLEERFVHVVEAQPDVLAHHWAAAGVVDKAAPYFLKAGTSALAHSATAEAIAQFTSGQALLLSLPDSDERRRLELDLQIPLGVALSAAKGMAAAETAMAYERARELCGLLNDEQRMIPVLLGLWSSHNARDELGAARTVAQRLVQVAEQTGDAVAAILGHRALGATLFELGEFNAARAHLQQLLEPCYPAVQLMSISLPYDPCISGRAWLSLTLSVLGFPEQALEQADRALADAKLLRHQNTLALVLSLRCSLGQYLRDTHDVARHARALLGVAVEREFAYWAGLATYFQGWAQARAGEIDAGIGEMRRGLAACQATGAHAYVPYNLAVLADMCRVANDPILGRTLLDEALSQLRRTGARYCESEVLCIDGELRLAMPRPDVSGAEASFRSALEVAHRQNAKATELRAAMCLARLWSDGGKRRQAYRFLAPMYGSFTEGFDTYHLVEAKRMLDALA